MQRIAEASGGLVRTFQEEGHDSSYNIWDRIILHMKIFTLR